MTRIERKLMTRTVVIGVLLTLLVMVFEYRGLLMSLERGFYDVRCKHFQYFMPPPSDALVHLDIDDPSLASIGAWPWPRKVLAQIVDEVHLAGAKAMAMDVIFAEPQVVRATVEGPDGKPREVLDNSNDPVFAAAIERFGRMLLPVAFIMKRPVPALDVAARDFAMRDLEFNEPDLAQHLRTQGLTPPSDINAMADLALRARRLAMYRLIDRQFTINPAITAREAERILLVKSDPSSPTSAVQRMFRAEFDRVLAMRIMRKSARPAMANLDPPLPMTQEQPPVAVLGRAASDTAFVNYLPDADGVVRSVPMWVEHEGWFFPQMGLSLACTMLDVDVRKITLEPDRIVIPASGPGRSEIVIPTRSLYVPDVHQRVSMLIDVPWFGKADHWETMYDFPRYKEFEQHLPVTNVWKVRQDLERIAHNNRQADRAVHILYEATDPERIKTLPTLDENDVEGRAAVIQGALKSAADLGYEPYLKASPREIADELSAMPDEVERENLRLVIDSYRALPTILQTNLELQADVVDNRAKLRAILAGKAVLMGWIATGAAADFVPTSMHYKCPGAVIHGVIFNGIMNGELWTRAPDWMTLALTLLLGALMITAVSLLAPFRALLAAVTLGGFYFLINGLLLFDYGNLIVGAAGPVVVVGLVWSGCTLYRFVVERRERARITRRFRSYVDPALVNYVIEHPEEARLDGQVRELTVVFTDLAGFTTIAERLKENTVGLLNEYMGLMVPVITSNRGFVNKFLGDGIMFFYGAPLQNTFHAANAIATVLKMQKVMVEFNAQLKERGLPRVDMRAGVSTGSMIVGDAGGTERSDYTVLGDSVNLGARLESANKATGTKILMTARTVELMDDLFLVRPVARLQVVGKTEGVMTYEPLAFREEATPEQTRLAELTCAVVDAFHRGDFRGCLAAIEAMEKAVGPAKFTNLYRLECELHIKNPPVGEFNGVIVLEEK